MKFERKNKCFLSVFDRFFSDFEVSTHISISVIDNIRYHVNIVSILPRYRYLYWLNIVSISVRILLISFQQQFDIVFTWFWYQFDIILITFVYHSCCWCCFYMRMALMSSLHITILEQSFGIPTILASNCILLKSNLKKIWFWIWITLSFMRGL